MVDEHRRYDLLTTETLERLLRLTEEDYEEVRSRVEAMRDILKSRREVES